MKFSDEKLQMIRRQVVSKIHWGARREEVCEWLEQKHGIVGEDAETMLAEANCVRRKAVRQTAIVRLVCSVFGIAISTAVISLFVVGAGHGLVTGRARMLVAFPLAVWLGWVSLVTFVRNVSRLASGESPGAVD